MAFWPALLSRLNRKPVFVRPSPTLFFWLVGAFILTLLPHLQQFPLWLTGVVITALVVRCVMEWHRWPLPSIGFTSFLALSLLAAIYAQFGMIFGRNPGTAFMVGLLAIKFYELRGARDVALIIFSNFFVVMSALLYSQTIELFVYCLIMMWVLTALLLRNHMGDSDDNRLLRLLQQSAIIFLQALPLAIFLFFFFPRYNGQVPLGLDDTSIGLSDKVEPGSISRLSNDDSQVMYITFDQASDVPSVDTMYWRGLVLWDYENGAWTQGPEAAQQAPKPVAARDTKLVTQVITVWPHFQRWLFALDYPLSPAQAEDEPADWSTILSGDILQIKRRHNILDHKERYTVLSVPSLRDPEMTDEIKETSLRLPENEIDPKVQTLAEQLRRENPDPKDYILAVLRYFRHEGFTYSDTPGASEKDWLTNFLFKNKVGFCEHYASAFAILMRLGHCPARVVVGYHGGQFNPYNNSYIVKQSNAHAWDEVWIDSERQWQRVDPTAVISSSLGTALATNSTAPEAKSGLSLEVAHHRFTLVSGAYLPDWMRRSILEFQLRRQEVEADWDDWVFSYDPKTQLRLAQALGFGPETRSALVMVCILAVGISIIVFRKLMQRKQPVTPIENLYAKFCRNMAQRGIPRAAWEGPLAYTERVAETFPEKKEQIHDVGWIVARSRYGLPSQETSGAKQLKSLLLLITASNASSSSRERS